MTESDDWDELNRELGVSKSPAPTDELSADAEADAELPEAEPFGDEPEPETDAGEADDVGAEGGSEEGPPGTSRKRRRRRRRKKKNGQPGDAASADAGPPAGDEEDEPAVAYPAAVRTGGREVAEADEEDAGEAEGDTAGETLAAEEDAGGELLRDLIANWDVPAWDQVIAGLHRPGR